MGLFALIVSVSSDASLGFFTIKTSSYCNNKSKFRLVVSSTTTKWLKRFSLRIRKVNMSERRRKKSVQNQYCCPLVSAQRQANHIFLSLNFLSLVSTRIYDVMRSRRIFEFIVMGRVCVCIDVIRKRNLFLGFVVCQNTR